MNLLEIPEIGVKKEVPSSYEEMTKKQVLCIMKNMHKLQSGKITTYEFYIRVLYKLIGIKRNIKSIFWELTHPTYAMLRNERIAYLIESFLGFLFTEEDGRLLPKFDLIKNHCKTLWIGPIRLIGPADGLIDISYDELRAADVNFTLYSNTRDSKYVDQLIAVLYRRKGPLQLSGRKIEPLNKDKAQFRTWLFRFVPRWKKQLILLWYAACVEYLQTGTFEIDGREISFSSLFTQTEKKTDQSLGWLGLLFDLAEKQTFGDIDKTGSTNILDVFSLLYNYKIQADNVRKASKTD